MTTATAAVSKPRLVDHSPRPDDLRAAVLAGLQRRRKRLPCKLFYDERGSRLFDQICELPEYYLTRTELRIMRGHAADMAGRIGAGRQIIELGSGSSIKTRLLLDALDAPDSYVPVDISREHLRQAAARLAAEYPGLDVLPVCADYSRPFSLPPPRAGAAAGAAAGVRRLAYFPGSTLGNFEPPEAARFLRRIASLVGTGGALLIGLDLRKDPARLHAAYNDAAGVTAAFNLNILQRINRELDADIDLKCFRHYAPYNATRGRVEMHLVCIRDCTASIAGVRIAFECGESIHTESSHKYTPAGFERLARAAGFSPIESWTDRDRLFTVRCLLAD